MARKKAAPKKRKQIEGRIILAIKHILLLYFQILLIRGKNWSPQKK
jgi:cell division protein FtsB